MLTSDEIQQIIDIRKKNGKLSEELKIKLIHFLKSGNPPFLGSSGDELCCDTGLTPPDRYIWTTFDNCKAIDGTAVDKSYCGH
jgi:hypothetical protein